MKSLTKHSSLRLTKKLLADCIRHSYGELFGYWSSWIYRQSFGGSFAGAWTPCCGCGQPGARQAGESGTGFAFAELYFPATGCQRLPQLLRIPGGTTSFQET